MTMMFEVEDLEVASPATVSRCGMVYMEPISLGTKPLIASWIQQLPSLWKDKKTFIPTLNALFDSYVNPSLEFVRENCNEITKT